MSKKLGHSDLLYWSVGHHGNAYIAVLSVELHSSFVFPRTAVNVFLSLAVLFAADISLFIVDVYERNK